MNEPGARWDGRQWVSADGLWAWTGKQWVRFGSTLPVVGRAGIYAAAGLGLNLPSMLVLALIWGLQGPGWAASPPDVIASIVQIALTLGAGLFAFCAGWFLLRIDRRDWWLGAVFGWPWIASAVVLATGSLVSQPPDIGALFISACVLLFAVFPLAGSIMGRRKLPSASVASRSAGRMAIPFGRATKASWIFVRAFVRAYIEGSSRH
jgi:hypothetical protein